MAAGIANSPLVRITGTAAGTKVIMAQPGNWDSLIIGTTTTGTAIFYNTALAAGTTATNQLMIITGGTNNIYPTGYCTAGLTAVLSGTVDMMLAIG